MEINVAMSSDDFYAPFVSTTMASILTNTKEHVCFYILCDHMRDASKDKIERGCEQFFSNYAIQFIEIDSSDTFAEFLELGHISKAMYGRFLIPELLPDVDRVIYTDVDVAFVGDIAELWNEDMENYAVGAVPSQRGKTNNHYEEAKLMLGLHSDHVFFMSGLLLLDCEKWRVASIGSKLLSVAKERQIPDQEVMNIYFDGNNYFQLSPKYCVIYKIFNECYDKEQIRALKSTQIIVHYPGGARSKPWYNPDLPSAEYFWSNVPHTGFADELNSKYGFADEAGFVAYLKKFDKVILYGAGNVGRMVAGRITTKKYGIRNICFAVTDATNAQPSMMGVSIYGIDELCPVQDNAVVVVAVDVKLAREIEKICIAKGFKNVVVVTDSLRKELESNSSDFIETTHSLWNELNAVKQDVATLFATINYAVDIRTIPKATGSLRELQLADVELLRIFAQFCKNNALDYWLFGGTLLGAVRHRGFIPWDDDLDVAITRESYNRIDEAFNKELTKYGFVLNFGPGFGHQVKRIIYEESAIQLDLWPFDGLRYFEKDSNDLKLRIKKCHKVFYRDVSLDDLRKGRIFFPHGLLKRYQENYVGVCCNIDEASVLYSGCEAMPEGYPCVFRKKDIYPFSTAEFEEGFFNIPCNPKKICREYYGDYLVFPKKKVLGHDNINQKKKDDYTYLLDKLKMIRIEYCHEK